MNHTINKLKVDKKYKEDKLMKCNNCGSEVRNSSKFCYKCGAKIITDFNNQAKDENKIHEIDVKNEPPSKETGKGLIIILLIIAIFLMIVVGILFVFRMQNNNTGRNKKLDEKQNPLYSEVVIPVLEEKETKIQPGKKNPGMEWDKSLFYYLEDVDTTSTEDGYLAQLNLSKKQFKLVDSDELIEFEIYSDSESGDIYKIVTIEKINNNLLLTDYYYDNEKLNFIFERVDSVYTPTYATIDKVGERFYFQNDVMVKWRTIKEPQAVEECTLTLADDAWYPQINYFEQTDDEKMRYDLEEEKRLLKAYQVYDAAKEQKAVGKISGKVLTTAQKELEDIVVDVFRKDDDKLLYRTTTNKNGEFEINVYLDGEECYLVAYAPENYVNYFSNHLFLSSTNLTLSYGDIVLHKESGEEYQLTLNLYDATENNNIVSKASVSIREGSSSFTGNVFDEISVKEGTLLTTLPAGIYTVEIEADGYVTAYEEIQIFEEEIINNCYLLPEPEENTMGVVLVWDTLEEEMDFDLTLFTPYQGDKGDMAHIGGEISSDNYGNRLVSDNTKFCEVIYVNTKDYGSYKVFVNDYTNSASGNYDADMLAKSNVRIYIYDTNGLVASYRYPAGEVGVVWEVAEINHKTVTPSQRVYKQLEGKNWWKKERGLSKDLVNAYQNIVDKHESQTSSMYDLIYVTKDNIPELLVNSGDKCYLYTYTDGKLHTILDGGIDEGTNDSVDLCYAPRKGILRKNTEDSVNDYDRGNQKFDFYYLTDSYQLEKISTLERKHVSKAGDVHFLHQYFYVENEVKKEISGIEYKNKRLEENWYRITGGMAPYTAIQFKNLLNDKSNGTSFAEQSGYLLNYKRLLEEFMSNENCYIGDVGFSAVCYKNFSNPDESLLFNLIDLNNDGKKELLIGVENDKGIMRYANLLIPSNIWDESRIGGLSNYEYSSGVCQEWLPYLMGGELHNRKFDGTSFVAIDSYVMEDLHTDNGCICGDICSGNFWDCVNINDEFFAISEDEFSINSKDNNITGYKLTKENIEKVFAQEMQNSSFDFKAQNNEEDLFDEFLAGNIITVEGYSIEDFYENLIADFTYDEFINYALRIDLDNDGELELKLFDISYGGYVLDIRDKQIYILDQGNGTASFLSYAKFNDKIWIVHSDTSHIGRTMFHFTQYDGNGCIVDEFDLNKEFWECEPDAPGTIYTYRDVEISKEQYYNLWNQIVLYDSF